MTWPGIGTLVPIPKDVVAPKEVAAEQSAPTPLPRRVSPVADAARTCGAAAWIRRVPIAAVSAAVALGVYLLVGPAFAIGAFAATALVSVVLVSGVRASQHKLTESDPATRITRRLGVTAVEMRAAEPTVALALLKVAADVRREPTVTVVQLSRQSACDITVDLHTAMTIIGDPRRRHDVTPGSPITPDPRVGEPLLRSLRAPALGLGDIEVLLTTTGVSILVIETASARWPQIVRVRDQLEAIGSPLRAVVVWTGRIPADPSHSWDEDFSR
ncbi:hypothetical protein GCM10007304_29610 [Rhodococcoides trifolii]|uniref:Uncharacterized protein n=1 Tax=Rhodococcoides trifolii TaxID=908250 RepID=A0A917FY26_9NOCA|nr:hypothetical protein [Rhodococcus trifolii]GGG13646.1 hypothetical protein GCM10007304_29610 [Rhodococcus trifolii]